MSIEKVEQKTKRGGKRAGSGRKKGTPNKISGFLKDAIIEATKRAGGEEGTVGYLERQANLNPGPFLTLLGKVLPTQIAGDPDNPLEAVNRIERVIIGAQENATDSDTDSIPTAH